MSSKRTLLFEDFFTFNRVFTMSRILLHILVLLAILPPIIYGISMSFRPASGWYAAFRIIPSHFVFDWYVESFNEMLPSLMNSYLRALGSSIIGLLICVPSAYAFTRQRFAGRKSLFYWIIVVQLFPPIIVVIPLLVIFLSLNLNDTIFSLWVSDMIYVIPFGVWTLRNYFASLPMSLEDAARVFGCSQFGAFIRVILPLTTPAMLAVAFLSFVRSWNEYLFAQLLTSNKAQVAIIQLVEATGANAAKDWGPIMAKTMIITLPPAVMYLVARRSIEGAFSVE